MFHRVSVNVTLDKDHFMTSVSFQRASDLYNESIRLQQEGKPAESTKKYLVTLSLHLTSKEALDLQAKLSSIPQRASLTFFPLPADISNVILSS